jgi:hypothetical protein
MEQQQPEDREHHDFIVPAGSGAFVSDATVTASALPGTASTVYQPQTAPEQPPPQQQPQGSIPPGPLPQYPPHVAPQQYYPQPIYVTQQVQMAPAYVAMAPPKSMAAALLLTFFFGPLGLFYASITGGIVMLIVTFVAAALTFGVSLLVTFPICMIWAAIATSNYNARLTAVNQGYSQNAR